jgi:rare lipoprotein A
MSSRSLFLLMATLAAIVSGCAGVRADLREGQLGAEQEGMATYYAPRLAGHRTANGERYDPARMTAAHPILPFGTFVDVERTDGSRRQVTVRINDRCAGKRKIIDLSEAAARQLQMMRAGLVPVRLRVVPPSRPSQLATDPGR